jgi:hypothetical protein
MEIFPQSEKPIDLCLPNVIMDAAEAITGELLVLESGVGGGEMSSSKRYAV